MMNQLLRYFIPITICLFNLNIIQAQCPDYNLTLETQQEIDQFAIDFPNCKQFDHNLWIIQYDTTLIQSMEPLSTIESIGGTLQFSGEYRSDLTDLYAFRNLESVKEFHSHSSNIGHIHEDVKFNIDSIISLLYTREISSLGNITLSKKMTTIQFADSRDLPGSAFEILSQVDTVEKLSLYETNIESLGTEYNIYVNNEFTASSCDSLISIDGISFSTHMQLVHIGNENLQGPLSNLNIIESIDRLLFRGGNFIQTLPTFSSLKDIGTLDLYYLPELKDFTIFENVEISKEARLVLLGLTSFEGLNFAQDSTRDQRISIRKIDNIENCTGLEKVEFLRNLDILECPSLSSLKGLESLKIIGERFRLSNLPMLEDLKELDNLRKVHDLEIQLSGITSLEGLESLEEIDAVLELRNLPNLKDISPLKNLKTFGLNPTRGEIAIDSLGEQYQLTEIHIVGNDVLESLFPIANLNAEIGQITITENPLLFTCSIAPFCNRLSMGNHLIEYYAFPWVLPSIRIENNKQGCNSMAEVLDSCSTNQVLVFLDSNEDNIRDTDEIGLPIGQLKVNDNYIVLPNHTNGNFNFYDGNADDQVEYIVEENWKITGPSNIYSLMDDDFNSIEIGIIPIEERHDIDVNLAFDLFICGEDYDLTAIVQNSGTSIKDVYLEFQGNGTLLSNFPDVNVDGFVEFTLEKMLPGEIRKVTITYTPPTVDEVTPGDVVQFTGKVKYEDGNGENVEEEKVYDVVFLCAYDPNDKQVFPSGVQDENYTLFEDNTLEYKIRFQNTGNFPARDIVILDTLSEFLNLNTLQYIHSSHPVTEIKLDRNVVEFRFEDIYLIDSLANEPESHGYVQFSIETIEDLDEFTEINNTAHIYFDSNPAIVTNTVFNTFVSEIPTGTGNENLKDHSFRLIPNPSKNFITIESIFAEKGRSWRIFNHLGQEVKSGTINQSKFKIDLHDLNVGTYFFNDGKTTQHFVKIE